MLINALRITIRDEIEPHTMFEERFGVG